MNYITLVQRFRPDVKVVSIKRDTNQYYYEDPMFLKMILDMNGDIFINDDQSLSWYFRNPGKSFAAPFMVLPWVSSYSKGFYF